MRNPLIAFVLLLGSYELNAAIDEEKKSTSLDDTNSSNKPKTTNLVPGYSAPKPQTQPQVQFPKPASPDAQPSTPLPSIPTQEQLKRSNTETKLQIPSTLPTSPAAPSPEPSSYLKTIRERQKKQALQQQPAPNGSQNFNFGDQKRSSISRDVPGKWPTDSPTQNPQQQENHRAVLQNQGLKR